MSSRFSRTYVTNASEVLENLEEICPGCYRDTATRNSLTIMCFIF